MESLTSRYIRLVVLGFQKLIEKMNLSERGRNTLSTAIVSAVCTSGRFFHPFHIHSTNCIFTITFPSTIKVNGLPEGVREGADWRALFPGLQSSWSLDLFPPGSLMVKFITQKRRSFKVLFTFFPSLLHKLYSKNIYFLVKKICIFEQKTRGAL